MDTHPLTDENIRRIIDEDATLCVFVVGRPIPGGGLVPLFVDLRHVNATATLERFAPRLRERHGAPLAFAANFDFDDYEPAYRHACWLFHEHTQAGGQDHPQPPGPLSIPCEWPGCGVRLAPSVPDGNAETF